MTINFDDALVNAKLNGSEVSTLAYVFGIKTQKLGNQV